MATLLKSQLRVNTAISATSTSNLVFIDAAIADYQTLANGVIPNTEVFLLEPHQDGIEQITAILANYRHLNLTNIHIIAHAIPGCLYLGNTHLGIDNLDIYQPQLQQWHHNINLLLYGCNVAGGDAGTEFITKLHQLTKANIAASRGRVGSAVLGGNWELDFCTANIKVTLAFTETTRQAYTGVFATFVVNDIGDSDDGDPNNGTTTLREAINLANNTAETDTITFAGIFSDDIPDTITLTSGQLTITDNVNIIGTKASQLTISGNRISRVFEISGAGTDVVIDGLNIANGNNSTAAFQSGGGILVNANSILSLSNSTVSGNSANRDGGGIFNLGTLSVSNSTVSDNTTATEGIYSGGGIYNNAAFSLVNSTVSNNSASFGGGIYNPQNRNISISDSIISGNSVSFYGGGINNEGNLNLSNSTIFDNSARQGGGIYTGGQLYYFSVGSATITNSTVSGNAASEDGGGIYNYSNVTVINSTIANNTADSDSDGTGSGGGIANARSATIGNTIIADNFDRSTSGDINPDVYNYDDEYTGVTGQFTDSGNNLIGNQGSNTDFTTSTLVGTTTNPIDPKLSPLQNNGGNTLTHALQTGSPAINAGNNSLVPANTSIDQRGADRIVDGTVDIGAYEDGGVNNPITTADTVVTNTNDSGAGSLRQALLNANANAGADIITFAGVFLDDIPDIINLTSGQLTITDDVTIMGIGASQLTISGNNTYRVVEISGKDTDATINGVKVANANNIFGAILVNGDATLDLTNSTVSNSSGSVGGIFNRGTLTLTNSTVSDNSGSFAGGGLYNSGTLNLNNSVVSNNTAYNYEASSYGGGIFNTGNLNIDNSTFANNRASSGAFARYAPPLLPATYGGSIYNSGIVNITNSTVSDSSAESGGGIYNAGNLNIINTTVSTNQGSYGGGIGNQGTLTVSNSTVTNNSTFRYQSDYFTIDPNGGGIFNTADGTATIANTIIAGNSDLDLPFGEFNPDVVGDFNDLGNNLIGDSTGSTGFTTSTLVGTSTNPIDPKLGPLQNNGGTTLTHALLTDSPAFNAGNNTLIPAEITTDQRGAEFGRISGGTVDIGAYEFPSSGRNLNGTSGDDALEGSNDDDTINGKAGNDTITGKQGDDSLTGGGGQDRFIYNLGDGIDTISDFGGVGTIFDAPATVLAEVDTIKFNGAGLTARNLLLAQNGSNVEITFEGVADAKVILENFTLENLDNFPASQTRGAIGNILFDGQTSFTNSYDVFDTYSTKGTLYNKNIVTFLNDRNNNVKGFNNSDDVINGLGGDDNIDGKSGNDLLRGGAGNDTLNGGKGNDILIGGAGNDTLIGGEGNDQFVYQSLSDRGTNGDTIKDFDRRLDQLVLTDLFKSLSYSGSNPISDGYLRFVQLGAATQVQVDQNGGADDFNTLVTLNKFTATNLVVGTNVLV